MPNFKSKAAYEAWLAYGYASGKFADTPGNQPVSIKGKSKKVKHARGGKLLDTLKLTGDTLLSTVGLSDVIGDENYTNQGFADASRVGEKIGQQAGQIAGNLILPGMGGQIVSTGQKMLGNIDGDDAERARIEQMRANPELYGKYSDSITQMNKAINPLSTGVQVAGTLGNIGATNYMQSGNVLGDLTGLKDSFNLGILGNQYANKQIPSAALGAFAYGGTMNKKKYANGGPIKMGEQVKPGSARHKELQALEQRKQNFLAQQEYLKSIGVDPNAISFDELGKRDNFTLDKEDNILPEGAEVAYPLSTGQLGVDFQDISKGINVFSSPSTGTEYLTGLSDPGDIPDYDLVEEDMMDMSIQPEKIFSPIQAGVYSYASGNPITKNIGYTYGYEGQTPESITTVNPYNRKQMMLPSDSFTSGMMNQDFGVMKGLEGVPINNFTTKEQILDKQHYDAFKNAEVAKFPIGGELPSTPDQLYMQQFRDEFDWDTYSKYLSKTGPKPSEQEIEKQSKLPQPIIPNNVEFNVRDKLNFAYGGKMNMMPDGGKFIEYEGPTHSGGGIDVDASGVPTKASGVAEVEGGETLHDNGIENYIFSDRLIVNPGDKKKKTFADLSKKINNKYKNSKSDPIAEKTRKLELEQLKGEQETLKQMMGDSDDNYACGGKIKRPDGGSIDTRHGLGVDINQYLSPTDIQNVKRRVNEEQVLNTQNLGKPNFTSPQLAQLYGKNLIQTGIMPEISGGYYTKEKKATGGGLPILDPNAPYGVAGLGNILGQESAANMLGTIGTTDSNIIPGLANKAGQGFNPYENTEFNTSKMKTSEPDSNGSGLPQDTINPLGYFASNIGNVYDLTEAAKETPKNKFARAEFEGVDYSEARREQERQAGLAKSIARENARNAPSAGGAMTNRVIANALISSGLGSQLGQSYMQEANANAQIKNQAEQINTQIEIQEALADQQDLAKRKSTISQALHNIGMNTQGYIKDLKSAKVGNINNKMWFDMVKEGKYVDYDFDPETQTFIMKLKDGRVITKKDGEDPIEVNPD